MRRVAVIAFLALVVVPGFAAHEEEEAGKAFQAALRLSTKPERQNALFAVAKSYPDTRFAPMALWEAASRWNAPDNTAVPGILGRLVREYPDFLDPFEERLEWRLAEAVRWTFLDLPRFTKPGPGEEVILVRRDGPKEAGFRFWRVPAESLAKALAEAKPGGGGVIVPPEKEWVEGKPRKVVFEDGVGTLKLPGEPGVWVVEERIADLVHRSVVRVPGFAMIAKAAAGELLVWVADPISGSPAGGVSITVRTPAATRRGETGPDGTFRSTAAEKMLVVGSKDGFTDGFRIGGAGTAERALVQITTDRPIYRPGQEVRFKAVRRDRRGHRLVLPEAKPVRVEMRGPEGRLLSATTATWNAHGSLSGAFRIGDEPPTGTYGILVHVRTPTWQEDDYGWNLPEGLEDYWRTTFRVAAYRKPELLVRAERTGDPVDGKVPVVLKVEHASGGPVPNVEVNWYAEAHADLWWTSDLAPELRQDPRWWFFRPTESYGDWDVDEAGEGDGTTDADGRLEISLVSEPWTTSFDIHAFVTDAAGLESENVCALECNAESAALDLKVPAGIIRAGQEIVLTTSLRASGKEPLAGRTVLLTVEGEEEDTELSARTDDVGVARFTIRVPDADVLCLSAQEEGTDERCVVDRSVRILGGDLWAGIQVRLAEPVTVAGETAHLYVRVAEAPATALLILTSIGRTEARVIRLQETESVLPIPVEAADAPGVIVRLAMFRDGNIAEGGFEVPVYPAPAFLDVTASTDRSSFRPGDAVPVTVAVRDAAGEPVSAEVELAIVDAAVLALAPDRAEDVRRFFLARPAGWAGSGGTADYDADYDCWFDPAYSEIDPIMAFEGGAGGEEGSTTPVRRHFVDTWHFSAHVVTGADGTATVPLTAPDNLTRWRILARAVAGADRFGQSVSEVVTAKPVVARLVAPRFLVAGDAGEVAIVVRNLLEAETEFTVHLEGEGIQVDGAKTKVLVPAGGEVRVDRSFRATSSGAAKLTAHAVSATESDAMELTIPVKVPGVKVASAAAGRVDGTFRHVFRVPDNAVLDTAKVEVTAGSPADAIREVLARLASFPYGCVEQTMSRFLPSVVAKKAMDRLGIEDEVLAASLPDMVSAGLARLYRFQHDDGGWGWWEDDDTDDFMTAYVVYGLATAKRAGVEVDESTLRAGLESLIEMEPTPFGLLARHLAGDDTVANAEVSAKTDAARALLVLAGRREHGAAIKGDVENPEEIAVVLRALHSLDPKDARIPDLVERLLAARRGGEWETTITSAHAVYALAEVVDGTTAPGWESAVNGDKGELVPGRNVVTITQKGEGLLFASVRVTWFTERPTPGDGRLGLKRTFERLVLTKDGETTSPLESGSTVRVGDEILVTLRAEARMSLEYLLVESPIPAGTEPWPGRYEPAYWSRKEYRDDRVAVADASLHGRQEFAFRLKVTHPGIYRVDPAWIWAMYEPECSAYSTSFVLKVVR